MFWIIGGVPGLVQVAFFGQRSAHASNIIGQEVIQSAESPSLIRRCGQPHVYAAGALDAATRIKTGAFALKRRAVHDEGRVLQTS